MGALIVGAISHQAAGLAGGIGIASTAATVPEPGLQAIRLDQLAEAN
jgi:hypothetical protein